MVAFNILVTLVVASIFESQGVPTNVINLSEGHSKRVDCPPGEIISITSAVYGKQSVNCYALDFKPTVQSICDGRNHCVVKASNIIFGDPCHGTRKNLIATYRCINRANDPWFGRKWFRKAKKVGNKAARRTKKAAHKVSRTVKTSVTKAARTAKRLRGIFKKKTTEYFGRVKKINWRNVPGTFLKYMQKCGGRMSMAAKCLAETLKSISGCNKRSCKLKIGGKNNGCLGFTFPVFTYNRSLPPFPRLGIPGNLITMNTQMSARGGLGLVTDLNNGKMAIDLYGSIKVSAKISLKYTKQITKKFSKEYDLLQKPKKVFRKFTVLTVGPAPVPLLIEVEAMPKVKVNLDIDFSASVDVEVLLGKAVIEIKRARIEFDPSQIKNKKSRGCKLWFKLARRFSAKPVVTAKIRGQAKLAASISIGIELTVKINGLPVSVFPAVVFKADGNMLTYNVGRRICHKGSLYGGVGINTYVLPPAVSELLNPAKAFGNACNTVASMGCGLLKNPATCMVTQLSKGKINPTCGNKAKNGCGTIANAIKKINIPGLKTIKKIMKAYSVLKVRMHKIFGSTNPCKSSPKKTRSRNKPPSPKKGLVKVAERSSTRIRCGGGKRLVIKYAAYGNKGCRAIVSRKVQKQCDGRFTCVVKASNIMFGDPCPGIMKYLYVRYLCTPEKRKSIKQNTSTRIRCGRGERLIIRYAAYGNSNKRCRAAIVSRKVRKQCDGRFTCVVKASNTLFGDPCPGIMKYLSVRYQCTPGYWVLQKRRVCFGAKGNSFGRFTMTRSGRLAATKLVHVGSGKVACYRRARPSNWGCNNNAIAVAITRKKNNAILFPNYIRGNTRSSMNRNGWYQLPGFTSRSHLLILKTEGRSKVVRKGENMRLWYGEDLKGRTESDNRGVSCADVYAHFN